MAGQHRTLTWTLILGLALCGHLALGECIDNGVVLPVDPYGFINETLTLTCQVTNPNISGDISAYLYFTHGAISNERVIPPQYVSIQDNRTVRLEYILKSGTDQGPFTCLFNQSDGSSLYINRQWVTVEYRALAIQHVECMIYNWEYMICTWDLERDYVNKDRVKVQMFWYITGGHYCANQTKTSCTWRANDPYDTLNPAVTYYFFFNVSVLSPSNKTMDFDTSKAYLPVKVFEYVKPAPVHNLTVEHTASTCVSLTWLHSRIFRKFRHHISWQTSLIQNTTTEENNITICDLHPARQYTFRISSIPIPPGYEEPKGFYSDTVHIQVTTLEDVPSGHPIVHTGSFSYGECSTQSQRNITIYWQPVPEDECNGEITGYNLTTWPANRSRDAQHQELNGSQRSHDLANLQMDTNYRVELKAKTAVGYSNMSAYIYMEARENKIACPHSFLVESTGSLLLVRWSFPAESETSPTYLYSGYTIYTCDRSQLTCRGEIQWHSVSPNQTSYTLNMSDGSHDKMIGISAEREIANQTISSGITWNTCVYLENERPGQVKGVQFPPEQPGNALLVEWEKLRCEVRPVHVLNYVVSYCPFNGHSCEGQTLNNTLENSKGSHVIRPLTPQKHYRVTIMAVSEAGVGPESEPIIRQVTGTGVDSAVAYVIGLAVGGAFVLVVIISMFVYCGRKIRKQGLFVIEVPPSCPSDVDTRQNHSLTNNDNNNDTKTQEVTISSDDLSITETIERPREELREDDAIMSVTDPSLNIDSESVARLSNMNIRKEATSPSNAESADQSDHVTKKLQEVKRAKSTDTVNEAGYIKIGLSGDVIYNVPQSSSSTDSSVWSSGIDDLQDKVGSNGVLPSLVQERVSPHLTTPHVYNQTMQ